MDTFEKYSYMDWWSGKICLSHSKRSENTDGKEDAPLIVSWNDIIETDVPRIKEKQQEIFNNAVNKLLDEWKKEFEVRFDTSKLREILLEEELDKFSNILLEPMHDGMSLKMNHYGVIIDYISLSAIKNHINRTKVNGYTFEFDFVHSENCPNRLEGTIPEVYAESGWEYLKWLAVAESTLANSGNINKKGDSASANDNKEPENPFPMIFKNGYAYKMFIDLKKSIVVKRTELADYSFIYRRMTQDDFQAIITTVTHSTFIEFLNTKQDADISNPKLLNTKTSRKEQLYNSILEKYKDVI